MSNASDRRADLLSFSFDNYVSAMPLSPDGRGSIQVVRDSLIVSLTMMLICVMALIVANTIFNLPFAIWLLIEFFEDLPVELEEAAMIDGASPFGAFFKIALPLVTPGLVATALFSFIFACNEFMFAVLLTRNDVRTLTIIVPGVVGGHEILWWTSGCGAHDRHYSGRSIGAPASALPRARADARRRQRLGSTATVERAVIIYAPDQVPLEGITRDT